MTLKKTLPALVGLACLASTAQAHVTYTGRNFGSFSGLEDATVTIANQAVTGNFGWADAADGILGDSHKGRAFRFHLDNDALISLIVSAKADAISSSIGGLLPGFSIYQGLAAIGAVQDHDGSAASLPWRTAWAQENLGLQYDHTVTAGSWNALGSWKVGGDSDVVGDFTQLSSFVFKGFGLDFDNDGTASKSIQLAAGDYTVFIVGNDISNKGSANEGRAYGLSATLSVSSSITPVPEPQTYALIAAGAGMLLVGLRRKR